MRAPAETVVFVSNATEGVNTVFRNLVWADDGNDVILTFSTVFESCSKAVGFIVDYFGGKVEHRQIPIAFPLEDDEILQAFRNAVKTIEEHGKRARICIFDVVSSRPAVVFPWIEMIKTCKELGVLSMVDGAQGVGMLPLDLAAADPDFFVSNCHKWLFVPRGCAMFYVPIRNQHLLPTTVATGKGYVAKSITNRGEQQLPSAKSAFVTNFETVGTKDNGPYLCVKDAIAWRRNVLGGEMRIIKYLTDLNKKGSQYVADFLGTEVLENSAKTMTDCAMANIALPIWVGEKGRVAQGDALVPIEDQGKALQWMVKTLVDDYKTFIWVFHMSNRYWVRVSAQVYLDMKDYEIAGDVLKQLCERMREKEYHRV